MSELLNNFYVGRILFIIVLGSISLSIRDNLLKRDNINLKDKIKFKNIDIKFLLEMLFLSFILRILFEQLISITNIEQTTSVVPSNILEIFMEILATVIFAPIFEEIIFRFGLYEKLNKKLNYIIAMVITSIIFALLHFYKLDGILILPIISFIWNYAYYKCDNLIYPIILHFSHNIYALSSNLISNNTFNIIIGVISLIGYTILYIKKEEFRILPMIKTKNE